MKDFLSNMISSSYISFDDMIPDELLEVTESSIP